MDKQKLVFLYSQSPRSGHNFVAQVLRQLVDFKTPVDDKSEIPFTPVLYNYFKTKSEFYQSQGASEYLDQLFIDDLRSKIMGTEDHYLMKYTSFIGAKECMNVFGDDMHIISLRDPKDCLKSLFKGMRYRKGWKSVVKKILLPFGIYHYSYSRKYSKRIENYLPDLNTNIVVYYEDLVKRDRESLTKLIELFQAEISVDEFIKRIDNISVINTSFFKEETNVDDMWKPSAQTERFNPVNRTYGFNPLQLLGIRLGCASLRKKMNYIE